MQPGEELYYDEPIQVDDVEDASEVSCGSSHTCALIKDGTIKCWGSNSYGELGSDSNSNPDEAMEVEGIEDAVQISAGTNYTCAALENGKAYCWGDGTSGVLGIGYSFDTSDPEKVLGLTDVTMIVAGKYKNTCAIDDGDIYCWGYIMVLNGENLGYEHEGYELGDYDYGIAYEDGPTEKVDFDWQ